MPGNIGHTDGIQPPKAEGPRIAARVRKSACHAASGVFPGPTAQATRWPKAGSLAAGFLGVGAWFAVDALKGRVPSAGRVIDIANPLGPGRYLVASGGGREIVNARLRTLDPAVERGRSRFLSGAGS